MKIDLSLLNVLSREIATESDKMDCLHYLTDLNDLIAANSAGIEANERQCETMRIGADLIQDDRWKQLLTIKYRRELSGKLKIMGKLEMQKLSIKSPDAPDALMLTFISLQIKIEKARDGITYSQYWEANEKEPIPSSSRRRIARIQTSSQGPSVGRYSRFSPSF